MHQEVSSTVVPEHHVVSHGKINKRQYSRAVRMLTAGLLVVVAAIPFVAAVAGWSESDESLVVRVGMAFALLAFGLMVLQIVIGSRLRLVSDPLGLGQLLQAHRLIGILVLALLLAHPLLVSLGDKRPDLLNPFRAPWAVLLGQAALVLLVVNIVLALFKTKFNLDYVVWRRIHRGAYLIFALGFVHSFAQGDDLKRHFVQGLWILLLVGIGLVAFHAHFLRPRRLRRNRYRVAELIPETGDTTTLLLAPENGRHCFRYLPGQFMFLTLMSPTLPMEEHPFTISSSPAQRKTLSATIKAAGDFTAQLRRLRAGDYALVDGPHGNFSFLARSRAQPLVFIAGGVGITPLMSMLRFLRDTGEPRRVRLIYANHKEADIIFREELERMRAEMKLRVIYVLSRPSAEWEGERGRISRELLGRFLEEDGHAAFYVCGPPAFMKSAIAHLRALGIGPNRIYSENFSL